MRFSHGGLIGVGRGAPIVAHVSPSKGEGLKTAFDLLRLVRWSMMYWVPPQPCPAKADGASKMYFSSRSSEFCNHRN